MSLLELRAWDLFGAWSLGFGAFAGRENNVNERL
jgi:hypothetical protein